MTRPGTRPAATPNDNWIDTAALIGRLPATSAILRRIIGQRREGRRDFPVSIPLHQAVALAAAAQAHARGVKRTQRVFDDIQSLGNRHDEFLVVLAGGKPPSFVPVKGFEPASAVVVDLAELRRAIVDGSIVSH